MTNTDIVKADDTVENLPAPVVLDYTPVPSASPLGRILDDFADKGDYKGMLDVCNMIASSNFVPNAYKGKGGDVMVAVDLGRSVGLPAIPALQTIAVINGKPSIYGDGLLAIVKANGGRLEETALRDDAGKIVGYRCIASRSGHAPVTHEFTIDDAILAGLWGKQGPWKQYPSRMLQMRARGFSCRDQFADYLNGMISREEAEDFIDVDYNTGEVLSRVGEAKKHASRTDEILAEHGKKDEPADNAPEASTTTDQKTADELVALYELANAAEDMTRLNDDYYKPLINDYDVIGKNAVNAALSEAWKRIKNA